MPFVSHARNLGIIFQSNLSWNKHITFITIRIYATPHCFKIHKSSLPTELRIKLFKTLIFPLLDYRFIVFNDYTHKNNNKTQRAVNCTIRFIYGLNRDEHIPPHR